MFYNPLRHSLSPGLWLFGGKTLSSLSCGPSGLRSWAFWPLLSLSRLKRWKPFHVTLGSWSSLLRSSAGGPWRRTRNLLSLPAAPRARAQHLPCWSLLSPVLQISTFLPASGRVGAPQLSTQPLWLFTALPHDISQPGSLTGSKVLLSLWADFYIHSRMLDTTLPVSYWCLWGFLLCFS